MFGKNVGSTDRIIRLVLGVALIAAYFLTGGAYSWLYLVGAAIALVTGLMSTCPLYRIFGFSTCPLNK